MIMVLALVVQIPLVLFCTRALSFWAPSITLEDRWALGTLLEVLVLASACYLYFGAGSKLRGVGSA